MANFRNIYKMLPKYQHKTYKKHGHGLSYPTQGCCVVLTSLHDQLTATSQYVKPACTFYRQPYRQTTTHRPTQNLKHHNLLCWHLLVHLSC